MGDIMNKKKLLWNLFIHSGKIEYYMEYKKVKDDEIIDIDFSL